MDTGSSHHVTLDVQKLNLQYEFEGPEALIIGDDSIVSITHTGSTLFPSQTFQLNEILYLPQASKSLVPVSKFCDTNKVYVEFFPFFLSCEGFAHKETPSSRLE